MEQSIDGETQMHMLVTGGAGFIGSNFIALGEKKGAHFTILDAMTYAASADNLSKFKAPIKLVQGDIRDADLVEDLVKDADVVVNFAAESHNDNSLLNPNLFFETNVMGVMNIANACVKYSVRLHHVSTDEVFGDLPLSTDEVFTLNSPYRPSSPYSASKASSDHIVRAWIRSFDLQATISNCSNNFGPNQHVEKLIPAIISSLASGGKARIYGDGSNVRDWIHVSDHVAGIWRAIESGNIGDTYLFGARDQVSNLELVNGIVRAMGLSDDRIEFIADRKGHDKRYAIDPSFAEQTLGWAATQPRILDQLDSLIALYS